MADFKCFNIDKKYLKKLESYYQEVFLALDRILLNHNAMTALFSSTAQQFIDQKNKKGDEVDQEILSKCIVDRFNDKKITICGKIEDVDNYMEANPFECTININKSIFCAVADEEDTVTIATLFLYKMLHACAHLCTDIFRFVTGDVSYRVAHDQALVTQKFTTPDNIGRIEVSGKNEPSGYMSDCGSLFEDTMIGRVVKKNKENGDIELIALKIKGLHLKPLTTNFEIKSIPLEFCQLVFGLVKSVGKVPEEQEEQLALEIHKLVDVIRGGGSAQMENWPNHKQWNPKKREATTARHSNIDEEDEGEESDEGVNEPNQESGISSHGDVIAPQFQDEQEEGEEEGEEEEDYNELFLGSIVVKQEMIERLKQKGLKP